MSDERRSQTRRPDDWLFEKLNSMADTESRHHNELRTRLDTYIAKSDQRMEDHSGRILTMEINLKNDKEAIARRHVIGMVLVTASLQALWEGIKRTASWH